MSVMEALKSGQQKNVIRHDTFDARAYQAIRNDSTHLQAMEKAGLEQLKTFDYLLQDMYMSLYQAVPKLADEHEIEPGYRPNRCQLTKLLETTQYREIKAYTELDPVASAMGAMTMAGELLEEYRNDPDLNDIRQKINGAHQAFSDAGEQAQLAAGYADMADGAREAGNDKLAEQYTQQSADAQAQSEALQRQAEELAEQATQQMGANQTKMRQAIRKASQSAAAQVKELDDVVSGWGFGSSPEYTRMPFDRKLELMQKMAGSNKFKKLAEAIGRYRNLARAKQKEKLQKEPTEIHSITFGNDLGRVLPSELVALRNPLTKKLFYRKYIEGQLLQYELKGKEKVGKGPIIGLIDSSGSTHGAVEEFIKGTAMGLLDIALKEKRAFAVIFFSSKTTPMKVIEFGVGENDPEKIYDLGTFYMGGGTDFETPLDEAVKLLEKSVYNKADIVLLTDGECDVSDEWLNAFLDRKKGKEFNVYTVLMNVGQSTEKAVSKFSNRVELIGNVLEDVAAEVFGCI